MTDEGEKTTKGPNLTEKHTEGEVNQSVRHQAIREIDLARENAIEKTSKAKEIKEAEKRIIKEDKQAARYEAIKKADLAREQVIEARQGKNKLNADK